MSPTRTDAAHVRLLPRSRRSSDVATSPSSHSHNLNHHRLRPMDRPPAQPLPHASPSPSPSPRKSSANHSSSEHASSPILSDLVVSSSSHSPSSPPPSSSQQQQQQQQTTYVPHTLPNMHNDGLNNTLLAANNAIRDPHPHHQHQQQQHHLHPSSLNSAHFQQHISPTYQQHQPHDLSSTPSHQHQHQQQQQQQQHLHHHLHHYQHPQSPPPLQSPQYTPHQQHHAPHAAAKSPHSYVSNESHSSSLLHLNHANLQQHRRYQHQHHSSSTPADDDELFSNVGATDGPPSTTSTSSHRPSKHHQHQHSASPALAKWMTPAIVSAGYVVQSVVSEGSFGTVLKARRTVDAQQVALKAVAKSRLSQADHATIRKQALALRVLRHRYIVQFHDDFEDDTYFYHVFEYLHGGDLYERLEQRGKPFSEAQVLFLARQIFHAVAFLHAHNAAHRDVKLENFVFETHPKEERQVMKIIDFDLLMIKNNNENNTGNGGSKGGARSETCRDMCGTILYVSPELASGREHVPEESDMWACGVMLFVLLSYQMPFQGETGRQILRAVRTTEPYFEPSVWAGVSSHTRALVQDLLNKNAADRPTAQRALERVKAIQAKARARQDTYHPASASSSSSRLRALTKGLRSVSLNLWDPSGSLSKRGTGRYSDMRASSGSGRSNMASSASSHHQHQQQHVEDARPRQKPSHSQSQSQSPQQQHARKRHMQWQHGSSPSHSHSQSRQNSHSRMTAHSGRMSGSNTLLAGHREFDHSYTHGQEGQGQGHGYGSSNRHGNRHRQVNRNRHDDVDENGAEFMTSPALGGLVSHHRAHSVLHGTSKCNSNEAANTNETISNKDKDKDRKSRRHHMLRSSLGASRRLKNHSMNMGNVSESTSTTDVDSKTKYKSKSKASASGSGNGAGKQHSFSTHSNGIGARLRQMMSKN